MKENAISQYINNRKSVFPPLYIDKKIPISIIKEMLENANRAPTHKLTQPWRFKIIQGDAKSRLGTFLSEKYKAITDENGFSERKFNKLKENAIKSDTVIAICMQRDLKEQLPEWEEIAAVAMAVQNLWLTASSYGIGGYWSSPGLIKFMHEFFNFSDGEKCLGFFYMGYYDADIPESRRDPIDDKLDWIQS